MHIFWRLLCRKKTKQGSFNLSKKIFLKIFYQYIYFGFFFANNKYVNSMDIFSFHQSCHQNSFLSDSRLNREYQSLQFLIESKSKKSFFESFNFLKTVTVNSLSSKNLVAVNSRTIGNSLEKAWLICSRHWHEWVKSKFFFLHYKQKYSGNQLFYKSNAILKDSKWGVDGQQMLHLYTYLYVMWQDFILNFCYFVYPNMHIFGKKYKKQRKWAVLKIRNYYGQYKWFLFYINQFINVDLKFLEYFKRGVVKWIGYDSFFQKWFFVLNTLISYRWRQVQSILNDNLKRNQLL